MRQVPGAMSPERQSRSGRSSRSRPSRPTPLRLENLRTGIRQMFTGRSTVGKTSSTPPESPKTPHLVLGLQNFSPTRIAIPHLTRPAIETPIPSPSSVHGLSRPTSSRPITPNAYRQQVQQITSTLPSHVRHNSSRRFVGVDSAEVHLAELAETGRRRRKARAKKPIRVCGPKVKNRRIRAKILACIISGLFLLLVLTVYLALSLTNGRESQEFHVLLILIILVTTIFFCHSLIRLCMMLLRPPQEDDDLERQNLAAMVEPGGYANPHVPIRIALARDEEAAGIESPATKLPPPAYGLWRESVRVDPNRIFWQRNEAASQNRELRDARPTTANRPPSYMSDDGIDYVVEAAPRSIAPLTDVPLPVHPSERGRVVRMS